MDYENKYKTALEKAKGLYNSVFVNNDILEQLFPELKESEDERVKRILYSISNKMSAHLRDIFTEEEFQCFDAWSHAWLEKQGKKSQGKTALEAIKEKPVDNANYVEQKFKVGDWVIENGQDKKPKQITGFENNGKVWFNDGTGTRFGFFVDYHLWTIQDAKDGDILVDKDEPFIFKGLLDNHHPGCPVAYCGLDDEDSFIIGSGLGGKTNWWCSCADVKPATEEQRDLLFETMKKAGYEWDDCHKELIQIKIK